MDPGVSVLLQAQNDATQPLHPAHPHQPAAVKGRSLWADAWARLKANRAAAVSAVYLAIVALGCLIGPFFTPHYYTTIYQDYVRVPPSFSPYPKPEMIEPAL
ncbi:hypothetical protein DYH09_29785, partial [bacterium CPR1]|nr:hypothetical protein [bacterium CPR1]